MDTDVRWPRSEAEQVLRHVEYWHYPFELPWGRVRPNKPGTDERHQERRKHFFAPLLAAYGGSLAGKRVLDLGCCQGFWSFEATRAGAASVLGIDSSAAFIREARALRTLLAVDNCEFRQAHLEEDPWWDGIGSFDICLFLGLFYHLTDPVFVLRRAMTMTREAIVVDTEFWASGEDRPAILYVPRDLAEPSTARSGLTSGLRALPTPAAVDALLRDGGFAKTEQLSAQPPMPIEYLQAIRTPYADARRGSFLAWR